MSGWGSCPQCTKTGLTCPGCGKCKKECCRCYPRTEIDSALAADRDRLRKHVEETMDLLALFGECEHGKECVPHAIAEVQRLRTQAAEAFTTGFQIAREMAAQLVLHWLFDKTSDLPEQIRSLAPPKRDG